MPVSLRADSRPRIKELDGGLAEQNRLAGGLAFSSTSRAGFIAPRDRPKGERSVRLPKNELLDLLFGMFARSDHFSFIEIVRNLCMVMISIVRAALRRGRFLAHVPSDGRSA